MKCKCKNRSSYTTGTGDPRVLCGDCRLEVVPNPMEKARAEAWAKGELTGLEAAYQGMKPKIALERKEAVNEFIKELPKIFKKSPYSSGHTLQFLKWLKQPTSPIANILPFQKKLLKESKGKAWIAGEMSEDNLRDAFTRAEINKALSTYKSKLTKEVKKIRKEAVYKSTEVLLDRVLALLKDLEV